MCVVWCGVVWCGVVWCGVCVCVNTGIGEGPVFDDKFAYVNIVCFDVGCFSLSTKCMRLGFT